jgi:hypothetical protein
MDAFDENGVQDFVRKNEMDETLPPSLSDHINIVLVPGCP